MLCLKLGQNRAILTAVELLGRYYMSWEKIISTLCCHITGARAYLVSYGYYVQQIYMKSILSFPFWSIWDQCPTMSNNNGMSNVTTFLCSRRWRQWRCRTTIKQINNVSSSKLLSNDVFFFCFPSLLDTFKCKSWSLIRRVGKTVQEESVNGAVNC